MQSQSLKAILIIVIAALCAVYLGVAAATAQYEAVAWVLGFLGISIVFGLGSKVWLLLPISLAFVGNVNALPGAPPPWAIVSCVVAAMYVPRFALGTLRVQYKFSAIDFAIVLQIVAIAQAFLRNPTGVMLLGGDSAGGKPYFVFAFAFVGYFILAITKTEMKSIKVAVICMVVAAIVDGMIAMGGELSPNFSYLVLHYYSNSSLNNAMSGASRYFDMSQARGGYGYTILGKALVLPCFALTRPLNAINPLKPWLFVPVVVGAGLVALSGFRSNIGYLAVAYIISALMRRKFFDIVLVGFGSFFALALIVVSGKVRDLPFGVQRVLSVLPLDVNPMARVDAESSTEWRWEMWEAALTSDRYIKNKILGDGFAFSAYEIEAQRRAGSGGEFVSNADVQDQMLATGTYHGFHVETIRFTGAFGLLCAIAGMIILGKRTWLLVKYYRGRPELNYLAYIFIPFLIYPFWSLLVFGAYRTEFPQFLAMAGFLKMIDSIRLREIAEARENADEVAPAGAPGLRFGGRP